MNRIQELLYRSGIVCTFMLGVGTASVAVQAQATRHGDGSTPPDHELSQSQDDAKHLEIRTILPPARADNTAIIVDQARAQDIPIYLNPMHVFLELSVNGSEPLSFAFDSGAPISIIQTKTAERLGLTGEGSFHVGGGGSEFVTASWINDLTLTVPGAEIRHQRVASMSLDMIEEHLGRPIDGIIGFDLFSRFVVEIDYQAKRMRLHDPETFEYTGGGTEIPVRFVHGYFQLDVTVTMPGRAPFECEMLLDSGAGLNAIFTSPYTKRNDLLAAMPMTIANAPGRGVGGDTHSLSGRIPSIQVGPFVMEEPIVRFSRDTSGAGAMEIDGILGAGILRRFTVIYDYSRKRLILEPNDRYGTPFAFGLLGAGLTTGGPGAWDTIRIGSLREDSAAQAAGILKGDVLVRVDGTPAAEIGLPALQEYFQTPGQVVRLVLERDGEIIEKEIQLKKIL